MALTISDAGINVQISRETRAPNQQGFGSLMFINPSPTITNRVKYYSSLKAVEQDYQPIDEPHKAATAFFDQNPSPIHFWVGQSDESKPGIQATGVVDFTGSTAAGDGNISISLGATVYQSTPSNGDTADQIGEALKDQINLGSLHVAVNASGVVTITSVGVGRPENNVVITDNSTDTGISTTITPFSGAADAGETPVEALTEILKITSDFYCVAVANGIEDDDFLMDDLASWIEANDRLFVLASSDLNILVHGDQTNIAFFLQSKGYIRTMSIFSRDLDSYPGIAAFAVLATTSFRGTDTVKTLKFKDLAGVKEELLDPDNLISIKDKNSNVLYSTASVRMFDEGKMVGGNFIDEIHGMDALAEEVRTRVFGLLSRTSTKVPYTERGMSQLKAEVEGALSQYVNNGYLGSRVNSQGDIEPAYRVWSIPVVEASPTDKANRIAPDIEFVARLSNAVHSITVNGVLTLD